VDDARSDWYVRRLSGLGPGDTLHD
jgi:hypothetical protein